MADSTNPFDIPVDTFDLVAGYLDGLYAWPYNGWARHASRPTVGITVTGQRIDAPVADYEPGNLDLAELVAWAQARIARGLMPTVYFSLSLFGEIDHAFTAAGITHASWLTWVADWNGQAVLEPGWTAHQYADAAMVGHHYDLSVAVDYWPGVDPLPPQPAAGGAGASITGWSGLQELLAAQLPSFASELDVLSSGLQGLG